MYFRVFFLLIASVHACTTFQSSKVLISDDCRVQTTIIETSAGLCQETCELDSECLAADIILGSGTCKIFYGTSCIIGASAEVTQRAYECSSDDTTTGDESNDDDGLTTAGKVGVALGAVLLFVVLLIILCCCSCFKKPDGGFFGMGTSDKSVVSTANKT